MREISLSLVLMAFLLPGAIADDCNNISSALGHSNEPEGSFPPGVSVTIEFSSETDGAADFDYCHTCPGEECKTIVEWQFTQDPGNAYCFQIDGRRITEGDTGSFRVQSTCASQYDFDAFVFECNNFANQPWWNSFTFYCFCTTLPTGT